METDYSQYEGFVNFFETPVFSTLLKLRNRVVMVITGNRFGKCVTYHTLIETPNGEIPVGKLFENKKSFDVYAWNGNKKVIAKAKAPFKKEGFHQCYKITMSDGRWIEAADNHRILCSDGEYHFVFDIYNAFHCNPLGLHVAGTAKADKVFKGVCFKMPFMTKGFVRDNVMDMYKFIAWFEKTLLTYAVIPFSSFLLGLFPRLTSVFSSSSSPIGMVNSGGLVMREPNIPTFVTTELGNPLPIFKNNEGFPAKLASYWNGRSNSPTSDFPLVHSDSSFFQAIIRTCKFSFMRIMGEGLTAYNTNFKQRTFSWSSHKDNIQHNHVDVNSINNIIKITPIGMREVYDFEVEKYHNYFAGGLIHHNTKSLQRKNVYRLMGLSPNPEHNIKPEDRCRVVRLAAENLPGDSEREVRNTIYPALMEQIPKGLVLKDITIRKPLVTCQPLLGGKPLQFEFVSYGQTTQSHGGVDRLWIDTDEVCYYEFYEESMPRLATTNGQFFVGTTPIEAGWMYDELFCKAKTIYRTKNVRKYMKEAMGVTVGAIEHTDSKEDIAVIQAATDDNPLFQKQFNDKMKDIKEGRLKKEFFPYENVSEYLDSFFMYDDPDSVAMRRYGIFKQITGAVHKEFEWNTHVISEGKHFPNGIPRSGKHCRMIDYHQSVPWAYCWIYIDENDEAFVVKEKEYDPYNNTTLGICRDIAENCRDYKFDFNLIDALANTTQSNSNTTVIQDMNGHFHEMKRSSFGTGGYWEPWDTKGTKGQDKIRERLINSKICGRPFNNLQKIDGVQKRLPTLWVLDSCKIVALSLKNWRKKENADDDRNAVLSTKDSRDKYSQRWSHFNMCLEAAMKDSRFRGTPYNYQATGTEHQRMYFQGRG